MKFIKYLFVFIFILAVAFYGYGFFALKDEVKVTRSITIERPAKEVFETVNSMQNFNQWSPWYGIDPDAKYTFSGPESGVGSTMSWSGNDEVGKGLQRIVKSEPHRLVKNLLQFDGRNDNDTFATIEIAEDDGKSTVKWIFETDFKGNIIGRYTGLLIEKMLAPQYETGLANLKRVVESKEVHDFSNFSVETIPAQTIIYLSAKAKAGQDMGAVWQQTYKQLRQFAADNDIEPIGSPMAITRAWSAEGWQFDAALPVAVEGIDGNEDSPIRLGSIPAGKVVKYVQKGDYDQAEQSYKLLDLFLKDRSLVRNGASWEVYLSMPGEGDEIVTHIVQPVQ